MFSEVLYDSAGSEPNWEWIEVYNNSATAVNLAGYVVDDNSTTAVSAANIAAGTIPAFATGILYNSELVTGADFAAAWGATLNLIPVTEWSDLQLNNTGDQISLWTSFAAYTGNHATHAGALTTQAFLESNGFPTGANGPSIFMPDMSADRTVGGNWVNAASMDVFGSFNATALFGTITHHPGGDVASPGSFTVVAADDADFDDDGDVDGRDFFRWQREFGGPGVEPLVATVAVPEPSGLILLLSAGLLGVRRGRA